MGSNKDSGLKALAKVLSMAPLLRVLRLSDTARPGVLEGVQGVQGSLLCTGAAQGLAARIQCQQVVSALGKNCKGPPA